MYGDFGEVLTAMVTPFDKELNLDLDRAKKLARYLIDNGSDGLVVLGTTGEVPTLSKDEKTSMLKAVVEEVGDEADIVAGTGSYSTFASIDMTKKAEEIGVDGIMLVTPYYNKPPQSGLYNHFSMIADKTSLPIMLYNVPSRTSRNLEAGTVKKLAEIDNIIAVKEASGDMGQVGAISTIEKEDFYIYSGDDSLTMPILSQGGQGVVSVASHIVGNEIKEMIRLFKKGSLEQAFKLNKSLIPIFEAMFITTNPIPVKTSLNLQGHEVGSLRPPLIGLTKSEEAQLKETLSEFDLL